MSNRLDTRFAELKAEGRSALIAYVCAGDPDQATATQGIIELIDAGADIVEVGMPFTDPVADGPSIQAAAIRALHGGQNSIKTLETVRQVRAAHPDTPLVLMGYYNPIYIYGVERFMKDAADAGVDGMIICDLPPEMDHEATPFADANGIALIRFVTPASDDARISYVLEGAKGFVYLVSIAGITGSAGPDMVHVQKSIDVIKSKTDVPVCVGFGVKTPEQAKTLGKIADGVIVGSALVNAIADSLDDKGAATASTSKAAAGVISGLAAAIRES